MNESNQRGTPPLKLSFFPFFLSLLLSRKKKRRRATTSRETTEEVRARRASRARAIPRRLKLERASRHRRCCCCLLFNAIILDAQFFFVSSFNGNYPTNFYQQQQSHPFSQSSSLETKKKGGDFYGHGQKCSLSLCVVIKSSLRPPCLFFLLFFLPHNNKNNNIRLVLFPTLFGLVAPTTPSLSLSLGVPFLSRSRAKGAKNVRARALNRTRRAGESLAPVGASELARARGEKPSPEFCVRANPKERVCWFPVWHKSVGEKKGRFSVTARSRARALVSRTDYLSIHRSIDRLEKKSKNDGRVCARAAFWSRVAARRR